MKKIQLPYKKIACILTAVCLILPVAGCKGKEERLMQIKPPAESEVTVSVRTEEDILREIITLYGNYQDGAKEQIDARLDELGAMDPHLKSLWSEILEYWDYANNEMPVNANRLPDDLSQKDNLCIVVLGFELNPDGSMQDELIGRLKVALECSKQYPNAYVCCTGGGTASENPEATEADLMAEWLKNNGVAEERLIVENKSLSTAQNAEFSYNIFLNEYPQINAVALVSSSYHIAWGSLLFESAFLKTAAEQNTPEVRIVSNAAFPTENAYYQDTIRFETGGMLQLIGDNDLAVKYYRGTFVKPDLK
ncbi:MAG: YdcF family protein [Lachnospiraceae bacterium]|nr:YdcF family protein [Lachnospiraceae bacterium]